MRTASLVNSQSSMNSQRWARAIDSVRIGNAGGKGICATDLLPYSQGRT